MHDENRLIKRRNVNFIYNEAPLVEEQPPVEEYISTENVSDDMKRVVCIDTGEVFDNAKEASKKTGANPSAIIRCCNGNCKKAGKLEWRYYE